MALEKGVAMGFLVAAGPNPLELSGTARDASWEYRQLDYPYTERGRLRAGACKDDPVLLCVEPLANGLNAFMRDRFYMTQGDGRGSHNMFPTPLAKMIAGITAPGSTYESKR